MEINLTVNIQTPGRIGLHRYKIIFKHLAMLSLFTLLVLKQELAAAQQSKLVVHLAKLEIDSAQLDNYKAALKEHAETAVRVEPGVLTLYAVYEKDHPTHVTVFEIYADSAAYRAHLKSRHFLKYKATTMGMVKKLELLPVVPIALEGKFKEQK
jgi:quinol monooxygenase YgiN